MSIKRYKFFTGCLDSDTIDVSGIDVSSSNYNTILQGFVKSVEVNPNENNSNTNIDSGIKYKYCLLGSNNENIVRPKSILNYKDNKSSETRYSYNKNKQIHLEIFDENVLSEDENGLFENNKIISKKNTITKETGYIWENTTNKFAKGLVSYKIETVNTAGASATISHLENQYDYNTNDDGYKCFYFKNARKIDNSLNPDVISERKISHNLSTGKIESIEDIANNSRGKVNTYQYASSSNLIRAEFKDVTIDNTENKKSAYYLDLASYSNEQDALNISKEGILITQYVSIEGVVFRDIGFLEDKCLYTTKKVTIRSGNKLNIERNSTYLLSYWEKKNDNDSWKYNKRTISGNSILNSNFIVNDIEANVYLSHIMIREDKCVASTNIYDKETMLLKATISNNGIPTIVERDELNREHVIATYKVTGEGDGSSHSKLVLLDEFMIAPISIVGNSRFNGFDHIRNEENSNNLFNSNIKIAFPKSGQFISMSGGSKTGLNDRSMFISCNKLNDNQEVKIKKGNSYKVIFASNRANLYVDNQIVNTSAQYDGNNATWQIIIIDSFIGIVVNGKFVTTYMRDNNNPVTEVTTVSSKHINSKNTVMSNHILVAPNPILNVDYLDFKENLIQSQMIINNRLTVSQNFFDKGGNIGIKTLPAYYPLSNVSLRTEDNPLKYRNNFAMLDYSNVKENGLTGEIQDFYNSPEACVYISKEQDKKYPFEIQEYEDTESSRLLNKCYTGSYSQSISSNNIYGSDNDKAQFNEYTLPDDITTVSTIQQNTEPVNKQYKNTYYQLCDTNGNYFADKIIGEDISKNISLTRKIARTNKITPNSDNTYKTFSAIYTNDNTKALLSREVSHSGKVIKSSTANSTERTDWYDVKGNLRLMLDGTGVFNYIKYDISGRVLETGVFIPDDSTQKSNYHNKVNDSNFPQDSDGTKKIEYTFKYDTNKHNQYFQLGYLSTVTNHSINKIQEYEYDQYGNIYKSIIQVPKSDKSITLEYEYDLLGNVTKVTYPSGDYIVYNYDNHLQVNSIEYKKNQQVQAINIVYDAEYDLYGNLTKYKQQNNFEVSRIFDMNGNLIYAGKSDKTIGLDKSYNDYYDPQKLSLATFKNSGTNNMNIYTYSSLGEMVEVDEGRVRTNKMTYDLNGKMTNFVVAPYGSDEKLSTYSFDYDKHKMTQVIKDNIPFVQATYDSLGRMNKYSYKIDNKDIELLYSDYFRGKFKEIKLINTGALEHSTKFIYDANGDILAKTRDNTSHIVYGYGYNRQLEYQEKTHQSYGSSKRFIYINGLLVAQYNVDTNNIKNLVYDNDNTLVLVNDISGTNSDYSSYVFGKPNELGASDIMFQYGGMNYLSEYKVYEDDGRIYFPDFGFMNTEQDDNNMLFTRYRKYGNCPIS